MVAKYYAVEVSENQVMHAIVTQKGDPYVPAYLLATAAFSKRAEADIKRGDTAGAATAIAAESKMASAGIKILSANPTWDPGPTMLPQFYAYEIQAVLLTKGCDPVIVPNLLKGQAASLKNAVPSSIKTQVIARQNVARACPNLAKYTALPKQQQ